MGALNKCLSIVYEKGNIMFSKTILLFIVQNTLFYNIDDFLI